MSRRRADATITTESGVESRHLNPVVLELAARGHVAIRERVPYEFQRGGNEMLVVRGQAQ